MHLDIIYNFNLFKDFNDGTFFFTNFSMLNDSWLLIQGNIIASTKSQDYFHFIFDLETNQLIYEFQLPCYMGEPISYKDHFISNYGSFTQIAAFDLLPQVNIRWQRELPSTKLGLDFQGIHNDKFYYINRGSGLMAYDLVNDKILKRIHICGKYGCTSIKIIEPYLFVFGPKKVTVYSASDHKKIKVLQYFDSFYDMGSVIHAFDGGGKVFILDKVSLEVLDHFVYVKNPKKFRGLLTVSYDPFVVLSENSIAHFDLPLEPFSTKYKIAFKGKTYFNEDFIHFGDYHFFIDIYRELYYLKNDAYVKIMPLYKRASGPKCFIKYKDRCYTINKDIQLVSFNVSELP